MHGGYIRKFGMEEIVKNKITAACFLIMIFGITIFSIFKKDTLFSENENRIMAAMPEFEINAVATGSFQKDYEMYLSDQFVLRDNWIRLKTYTDLIMAKRDVNGVYFGKGDYLIERQEEDKFTSEQAEDNYNYLKTFAETYGTSVNLKIMLIPNASEILADRLPKYAYNADETQIINNVYESIRPEYTVNVTDTLKEHRDEYIYYRTDHHWTTLGAFYAYKEYAKSCGISTGTAATDYDITKVSDNFFGTMSSRINMRISPDDIYIYNSRDNAKVNIVYNNSEDIRNTMYDMEVLASKDKYSVFLCGNNEFLQINTSTSNDRKILVIKDSFAHCFIPFMEGQFDRIDVVDLRYCNDSVKEMIEKGSYTDVLLLYNIGNFVTDSNIFKLVY